MFYLATSRTTAGIGAIGGAIIGASVGAISTAAAGGGWGEVAVGAMSGALSGGLTGGLIGIGVPLPVAAGVGSVVSQTALEALNGTLGTDTAMLRIGLSAVIGVGVGTLGYQILPEAGLPGRILVSGTTGFNKTAANRLLSEIDAIKAALRGRTQTINRTIDCP